MRRRSISSNLPSTPISAICSDRASSSMRCMTVSRSGVESERRSTFATMCPCDSRKVTVQVDMSEPLAELFSSRVRAVVLALLLSRPHLRFSLTDLSRRLGLPVSSLQHECYKLTRMGVLRDERVGNTRLYCPNLAWPLLEPLTALTVRALPLTLGLTAAVEGVSGLEMAWLSGDDSSFSDPVYVLLVGEMSIESIDGIFSRSRVAIDPVEGAQRVELAYFRPRDWQSRIDTNDAFAVSLRLHCRLVLFPLSAADAEVDLTVLRHESKSAKSGGFSAD